MDDDVPRIRNLQEAINHIWGQIQHERQDNMDIQRRVPGQVDLPGVNIVHERVGDAERSRTVHHIKEMEAKGYIPPEEADKRIEHAANADSKATLNYITADLPAPVYQQPGYWKGWNWDKP